MKKHGLLGALPLRFWLVAAPIAVAQPGVPGASASTVDAFDDVSGWSAHPADGVELELSAGDGVRGGALRLDFRFEGGGYAVARKAFALDLPANYAFSFQLRGTSPPNHVEFKLIDASGENVWWSVRRDVAFTGEWQTFTIKKRQISFAWGPRGGGEIEHVAAIEFAITAGSGGTGTVWIDELVVRELPPAGAPLPPPVARASSSAEGHAPESVLDGDVTTFWSPAAGDPEPSLTLDFGQLREYGGLVVDWVPGTHVRDYVVEGSDDGQAWRVLRRVERGNGGRDYHFLRESESHFLRLRLETTGGGGEAPAIRELELKPLAWAATRETFFEAIARDASRGSYPRGMSGQQVYWAVVGIDGDRREGLLSEDGMLETGKGSFSIEPFLLTEDALVTWSDVEITQSLDQGFTPIPSVGWRTGDLSFTITAFGIGAPDASSIVARYQLANSGPERAAITLVLALRPFQVNPPSQTLNIAGGTAPVHSIAAQERTIVVNGEPALLCLSAPAAFGAATFDEGDVVTDYLRKGDFPERTAVEDPFAAASAALAFPLEVATDSTQFIDLLVPLYDDSPLPAVSGEAARDWVDRALEGARDRWRALLERAVIDLTDADFEVEETLKAQLGYILVSRAGPAIQPGVRSYARSWIRDGALTSSALLRLGHPEPVREFIEWYAPHQYENGKIPCVVDARGADPVPEHDSSGEFIFLIAEYYRYQKDRELAERMWPRVLAAADYLDALRQERRTDEYRTPENAHFFGILPPSISHEGYSAKPMHSYWDDFFALRGFKDAVFLAAEFGRDDERQRLAAIRDEFEVELVASIEAAMKHHGIDYIPGCADLGDFDPTSTTIALSPVDATGVLPPKAVKETFLAYQDFFYERWSGEAWDAYTPYEIRNIGAFARLGWREGAASLIEFFMADQRPPGWRQWPEVVRRDARKPAFLGDLPHTWVGSDFIRSILDMLVYVDEHEEALVIAHGIPPEWLRPAPGVVVRDLPTPYGILSFSMHLADRDAHLTIEGAMEIPHGGILIDAPLDRLPREATVNGEPATILPLGRVAVRTVPATVVIRP